MRLRSAFHERTLETSKGLQVGTGVFRMVAHHHHAPTEPAHALISPSVQFAPDVAEQFAGKDVKKDKSSRALTIAAPISREDHRVQGGNTRIGGSEMSERLRAPRLPPIFFGDHNGRLAGLSAGPLRFDP